MQEAGRARQKIFTEKIEKINEELLKLTTEKSEIVEFQYKHLENTENVNSKESQRIKELESLKDKEETLIIYEAPHRIKETLSNILEILGNRNITLSRELTKKYEEVLRGTVKEILEVVDELKGEMVLVIQGKQEDELTQNLNNLSIKEHYNFYIEQGVNFKEALKIVAKDRKVSKSIIYQEIFGKNK